MIPNIDLRGFLIVLVVISGVFGWGIIELIIWLSTHIYWA